MKIKIKVGFIGGAIAFLFILFYFAAYTINAYKLFKCDFQPPYKSEICHAIGLAVPGTALLTVWIGEK